MKNRKGKCPRPRAGPGGISRPRLSSAAPPFFKRPAILGRPFFPPSSLLSLSLPSLSLARPPRSPGEWLSDVAADRGVTIREVLDCNPGLELESLYGGQHIRMPLRRPAHRPAASRAAPLPPSPPPPPAGTDEAAKREAEAVGGGRSRAPSVTAVVEARGPTMSPSVGLQRGLQRLPPLPQGVAGAAAGLVGAAAFLALLVRFKSARRARDP